jgi:Zn-finger nucleic acid-binding protein
VDPARILVACSSCARQYDATHLAPGEKIRCECGERVTVEHRAAHTPRPIRCGACGGPLEVDARACAYCDAQITLEERRLAEICPVCFARMLSGARFCMECGVAIKPQAIVAVAEDARCPRCNGELRSRAIATSNVIECKGCAGLWLDPGVLESLCERAEASPALLEPLATPSASAPRHGPMYLPCIRCDDRMTRKNFGGSSGIVIDLCKHHGAWLDHTELDRILAFVRGGGLARARERESARAALRLERAQENARPIAPDFLEERRATIDLGDVLAFVARLVSR